MSKSSIKNTQLSNRGQTTLPAKFGRRKLGLSGFSNSLKGERQTDLPVGNTNYLSGRSLDVTCSEGVKSASVVIPWHERGFSNTSGSPRFRRTARGFESDWTQTSRKDSHTSFPSSLPNTMAPGPLGHGTKGGSKSTRGESPQGVVSFHPVANQMVAEQGEVTPMASLFVFNKFSMLKILEVDYLVK